MKFEFTKGGVCSPKGFLANGVYCGLRRNATKRDLSLIYSEVPCIAAAVYTQNVVKGSHIIVDSKHLEDGVAQALVCNSANANTCNADGVEKATKICEIFANQLNLKTENVLVASTGVIGQILNIEPIIKSASELCKGLSNSGNSHCAEGIMTTDTFSKEIAVEFYIGDTLCKIGGVAKGSGMIHPNMATLLCFVTTDVAINKEMLQLVMKEVTVDTFNMISIDGDTSTNDMVCILSNGLAGNIQIVQNDDAYVSFKNALFVLMRELSKLIAKDGEGASKLIECNVYNSRNKLAAKQIAKSVIQSSLVKCAMYAADANWGRVLCAIGYATADIDVNKIDVEIESIAGKIDVCKNGAGVDFCEDIAKEILLKDEIKINICLNDGNADATAWGCDLTYGYIKINGDYRT